MGKEDYVHETQAKPRSVEVAASQRSNLCLTIKEQQQHEGTSGEIKLVLH